MERHIEMNGEEKEKTGFFFMRNKLSEEDVDPTFDPSCRQNRIFFFFSFKNIRLT